MLVGIYDLLILNVLNVDESCIKLGFVIQCLSLLNDHHILNCFDDIELIKVLPKLALLDLREVQHVLNHELEAEG
jgi:hypothetical protein